MTVVGQNATGKTLVVYFSATGTTARAAQRIARETKADLYEIRPVKAYTAADLDWRNARSRSSVEMNDPKSRPAIALPAAQVAEYEVIYLGYPIWWDMAPRAVQTFIESHDLKGKKIIPFATSGSSGIANSVSALRKTYPDLNWQAGRLMNR
ncbi:flavodoxin [uncultured Rikenella sp.]|uniref:flavodoxin n=1 Tax=uncultured Rikenella sp. TaxID=368003 RepID=UPI0025DA44CD|nr:flavodoxin [uncultured Rikenella sp.]